MFVIMLVLFGLSFKVYTEKTKTITEQNTRLKGIEKEYVYIKRETIKIESFKSDSVFLYLTSCDKFVIKSLKGKEIFVSNTADLKDVYLKELIVAGHAIESYLNKYDNKKWNPSFLLILEGYMEPGYDNKMLENPALAYQTSYQRALGVFQFWEKAGIVLQKKNVEILISGRGFDGICKENRHEKVNFFSIRLLTQNDFD
jgi:hypothetical protein